MTEYISCKVCGMYCKQEELSDDGRCLLYCDTTGEIAVSEDRIYGIIHATWITNGTMFYAWNMRAHIMCHWEKHYTEMKDKYGVSCRRVLKLP